MEADAEGAEVGRVRRRRDGDEEEEEEEEEEEAEDGVDDEVSLVSVSEENIGFLKNLNTVLFPINYQHRYYAHVLSSGDFSKLAFLGRTCVGSITCRIERRLGGKCVNILTLGVLAPYRRRGIGSKLMNHVMGLCEQDEDIVEMYLHVQTNNDEAIKFYKKFEFEIRDTIRNYYKRIDPPDCYILSKSLRAPLESDGLAPSEGQCM